MLDHARLPVGPGKRLVQVWLQECAERFRTTFELVPVGLGHVDWHGRWLQVNQRLCTILGYKREELMSLRYRDVVAPADADLDLERLEQMLRGDPRGYSAEKRLIRKGGDSFWCQVNVVLVRHHDGTPKYFVFMADDISARKRADALLGDAAHELRLPLSHIKGFVSSLRRTDYEWDTETRKEFLEQIDHEADRLAFLIEDLMERAQEGRGESPSERVSTTAGELVLASLDRVRAELDSRVVRIDTPLDLPLLEVDSQAMERVLANLLDNANKYSAAGTPIDISARVVGRMLEVRVDDQGPGVPANDYERIFEPFYRTDSIAGATRPGHGLGLAICRSIVSAHRGQIWAVERPGGGTRFTVALPFARRAHHQSSPPSSGLWPGASRSTLARSTRPPSSRRMPPVQPSGFQTQYRFE
jgi:PAS domain S-box-containing protein